MKSKTIPLYFVILLLPLAMACPTTSDLGTPCVLIKRGDDGKIVELLEKEAKKNLEDMSTSSKGGNVTVAIVSLGVPECEDLACVRDAKFNPGATTDSAPARGYCTERCSSEGSACKANDSKTKYACHELMRACDGDSTSDLCDGISSSLFCTQE
ncbi:MAG: adventurous gliding motility lipoprotein CglC [Cystobacterineae bacterium]|nr:adventurous gliding motility lipoprotein CglC [Cystobacterineae bacterium]